MSGNHQPMKEQQQCVRQSHVASPVAKAKQESQHSHDKQRGHEVIEKPTRKPSDAIRIVGGLPDGGKRAVLYNRRRTAQTMLVILGGWSFLILSCLAFKLFALRVRTLSSAEPPNHGADIIDGCRASPLSLSTTGAHPTGWLSTCIPRPQPQHSGSHFVVCS